MRRDTLADLTAFITIADTLSFRVAALRLGITPSALSHTMRHLEERLGVRLLHRTTRSVSLTDAGLRLLERLRPAMEQIAGALEDLNEERQRPFGRLRILANNPVAAAAIVPVWERFLAAYPDVHLELLVDQSPLDIVAKGFDAGLGSRQDAAADMVAVRVTGPLKVAVVGAPAYFARHAPPRTPNDLARHSCVQYRWSVDSPLFEWQFERDGAVRHVAVDGRVIVSTPDLGLRAAIDGLGIGYTLEGLAAPFLRSGQLIRVLEDWSSSYEGTILYYPGHRQVPAALRALIDMLSSTRSPDPAEDTVTGPCAGA